jgi:hypothetical protein
VGDNYAEIVRNNIEGIFRKRDAAARLAKLLPGDLVDEATVRFSAFGEDCRLSPEGIFLGEEKKEDPMGIVISLYAMHIRNIFCMLEPLKAFKDFPNSMPFAGAFVTHTQNILVDHVDRIQEKQGEIIRRMDGRNIPTNVGGDFSLLVYPLPKIALSYIFYEADEDFPASATCLFSSNADEFLPIDGLADLGEYTSKAILGVVG